MGDGFEGFDGAFGAAGKIYDDGVARTAATARDKTAVGVFSIPLRRISSETPGIRRSAMATVASGVLSRGPMPVPPVVKMISARRRVGDGAELFANRGWIVGEAQCFGDFPAETAAKCDDCGAGGVFAVAFGGGVADGENGYAHVREALAI